MQRAIAARLAALLPDVDAPARARARLRHRTLQPPSGRALSRRQLRADRRGASHDAEVPAEPRRRASPSISALRSWTQAKPGGHAGSRPHRIEHDAALACRPDGEPRAPAPAARPWRVSCSMPRSGLRASPSGAPLGGRGAAERARRHPAASGHRRRGAAVPGCERARLSSPHEIGGRPHPARRLPAACRLARFAAPSAPPTQKAAASPGTSSTAGSPPTVD